MGKGTFITFEGGEGVGKTTQIKYLEAQLKSEGYDVVLTREPGGTPSAEEIRRLLSDPRYGGKWTPEAELLLLFAARSMHIKEVIAPALAEGKIVISDRYIDSTRVYQGIIHKLDNDFISELEENIVGDYIPDITIIMDLTAEEAMNRVHNRGGAMDHYDRGDLELFTNLRLGFIEIAREHSDRCIIIDAALSEEEISQNLYDKVRERL